LIETIIVLAMIVIVFTLALPIYSNYIVRNKIEEALSVGESAKSAITEICRSDQYTGSLATTSAGYSFEKSQYLSSIDISGFCTAPVITITTRNTGVSIDPVLRLTGAPGANSGEFSWACTVLNEQNNLAPDSCRD